MALRLSSAGIDENIPLGSRSKKTVEETYTKLSQLEHVLVRPDTYIGSVERSQQTCWIWDEEAKRMVNKEISYPPGLYKIFDEILVNAADHAQRDSNMDCLKVEIGQENQLISVWNNGAGIPVEIHQKEKVYVPELIFGHLLTSSNYDDNEKKVVGGRNGFGAKLANIFSTEFTVETADARNGKRFKQVFRDNMNSKDEPIIRSNPKKEAYTKISFSPDLSRFGLNHLDDDIVSLMKKRVYDIAGANSSMKVYLNGSKINIKSFKDYVNLYPVDSSGPIQYERLNDRWEVAITASDGQLNQVSFVNSIWTIKGGTHVAHVADAIVTKIGDQIRKKNKGLIVRPFQIKSHLSLFINCLIENPSFDSQTKETLTTKAGKFGSKWTFSDDFAKKVVSKSAIIENVLAFARFKQSKELAKTDGGKKARVIGIAKLDDANKAGSREASKCTLILTEGDSAKALAVSGLSVVGRDYYGVFPLRGKLLNVREAKHKQIMDNAEINNLKKILGLQHNKTYDKESVKTLRYGHVLIMADQDHDGSHIKGLVINFFDHFWPSLLQVDGFIQEFITPIVKCVKGKQDKVFFTVPQYKNWASSSEANEKGWKPKYYKGLGTSTAAEAKGYFSNLPRHLHEFQHCGDEDSDMIELAFSKQRVNDRKEWLSAYVPGTFFDHDEDELNYSNFVNKELILFSVADNSRSIPSIIDGFKPSQRKVLFACFKRKLTKTEIKVVQLAGYVSEHAAYHHGEMSLQATIVGLAQNFIGSNNLNLLVPAGQFGTRLQGGKDAASSRYIFTKLAPIARAMLPELDDPLLSYLEEDGTSIEPKWYCPVIPLVLVNGSDGIGTGWSSFIPCYNPRDLIRNIRCLLNDEEMVPMSPWYRGFKGAIVPVENSKSYDVYGTLRKGRDENTFKIDELPIRSWTTPYKEFLESNVIGNSDAKTPFVKDFVDNGTENKVHFTFSTTADHALGLEMETAYKRLKLSTTLSTNNMVLFDAEGRIRKYDSPEEIIQEFFKIRLNLYNERRAYMLRELEQELLCLDNKQRFITMVIDGKLKVAKRKKIELIKDLKRLKFDQIFKKETKLAESEAAESDSESEGDSMKDDEVSEKDSGYDYLLSMPLWSLTMERVRHLGKQRDNKEEQKITMEGKTGKELWETDLINLEIAIDKDEKVAEKQALDLDRVAKQARMKQRRGGNKRKGAKAVVYDEETDDEELEMIPLPNVRTIVAKVPRAKKAEKPSNSSKAAPKRSQETVGKRGGRPKLIDLDDDSASESDYSEHSEGDDAIDQVEGGGRIDDGGISDGLADMSLAAKKAIRKTAGRACRVRPGDMKIDEAGDIDLASLADEDNQVMDLTEDVRGERKESESPPNIFELDDDDEIQPAVQKVKAATKGRKKASVRAAPSKAKKTAAPKPPKEPEPKQATAVAVTATVISSSDEEAMTLSERIANRLQVSKAAKASSSAPKAGGANAVGGRGKKAAANKPTAVKRGAVPKKSTKTTEIVELEISPGKSPMPKKTRIRSPVAVEKKKTSRAVAKKKLVVDDSEDDEDDVPIQMEKEDTVAPPAPSGRARPRRAAARKIVIEASEDSEDNLDDDDSDFEG